MRCRALLLTLALVLAPGPVRAGSTVRYALVVGNNEGHSGEVSLETLLHAEREAQRLHDQLLRYANFDPQRVQLVLGGGREAILGAARQLAEQHRRDVAELGELPSLFAFFFTGHGFAGRLLTADQPLSGEDLASVVRLMNASLSLGFFDACFSGGLDLASLRAKGLIATPGFNPVAELPREVLDSEGTMWFASSRPEELSYEDDRLGGLFIHFFSEAFTLAQADGVGVTLESMWEYAAKRTAAYAAQHGRTQTPEKIIRNLKARGPLYFSFPQERTAKLRFHQDIVGSFLLSYEQSALVERIEKPAKGRLEVAVYDGPATLRRVDAPGAPESSRRLLIEPGATLMVQPSGAPSVAHAPGFGEAPIHGKGTLASLEMTSREPRSSWLLGAGYRFHSTPAGLLGAPHAGWLGTTFARGSLSLGLELEYGRRGEAFTDWSYKESDVGGAFRAGLGWDLGGPRVDLEAGAGVSVQHLSYQSGESRSPAGGQIIAGASVLVPLPLKQPWLFLQLRAGGGIRWAQGIGEQDHQLHPAPVAAIEAGLAVPISY